MKLVKVEFIEESKADAFFNVTIKQRESLFSFKEKEITRRAILEKVGGKFYYYFSWSNNGRYCYKSNIIAEMILQYEKCIN